MEHDSGAMLHQVAHDSAVHAALLMDLLRIAQEIDPAAFQQRVEQAARDLQAAAVDPKSPLQGRNPRSVLEHRLAYLRSVQIQAAVGYGGELSQEAASRPLA